MHEAYKSAFAVAAVAGAALLPVSAGHAQSTTWFVHSNCNVSPCVMGVADQSYATPGNARWNEGWRRMSQGYSDGAQAWRTACRWHYGRAGYTAPDIASGTFSCASVCANGTCQ
jgi:hypothetical protein